MPLVYQFVDRFARLDDVKSSKPCHSLSHSSHTMLKKVMVTGLHVYCGTHIPWIIIIIGNMLFIYTKCSKKHQRNN